MHKDERLGYGVVPAIMIAAEKDNLRESGAWGVDEWESEGEEDIER